MGSFKRAVKTGLKLRMAITGPAGSGKTYTALRIATAMGLPIAYLDTEHGSASKYADLFDFDVMEMRPPFNPERFVKGIEMAAKEGYKVIVIDSLSHAWNGTGGILEMVEEASVRLRGNSYAAWKDVTPKQNALIEAIVGSDIHIIATMRSKMDYVQDKDERGKTTVTKVGMAPVQREGFEYEFDVVMDMDIKHNGIITKTRCPALTDKVFRTPGEDVAATLTEWLNSGGTTDDVSSAEATEKPKAHTKPRPDTSVDADEVFEPLTHSQRTMVEPDGDEIFEVEKKAKPKESPPHQRVFGQGLAVFGPAWNNGGRKWLLKKWTGKATPDNVRDSLSDLNDDEKDVLADYIKENAATLQRIWGDYEKSKASQEPEPQPA